MAEEKKPEQATTTIIIGAKDHGKTDYVKGNPEHNLPGFIHSKIKHGMKVLVIDTQYHASYSNFPLLTKELLPEWQQGVYRLIADVEEMPEIYRIINDKGNTNLWNTFIIWEDALKHCFEKMHKDLRRLVIDSKNKGIEMIFMYHAWGWVPNDLYKVIQYIEVFKTADSPKKKLPEMPGYEDMAMKIYTEVAKSKNKYYHKLVVTGI